LATLFVGAVYNVTVCRKIGIHQLEYLLRANILKSVILNIQQ